MYIERTHFYAKQGRHEAVRWTRERACDVRVGLGLKRGTILHKVNADDDGPDVVWACAYASEAEYRFDLKTRAESAEFEALREEMRTLIDSF